MYKKGYANVFTGLVLGVFLFGVVAPTQAASLNYNADVTVSLTSSAINLTIKSGSVADSLVVSATNVAIGMSSSTGGAFVLTSPQALGTSISGSGGNLALSCSAGIQTATITQTSNASTYTLTPSGSACSGNGGGGGGGIVGVGGGSNPPPPTPAPPSPPPTPSPSSGTSGGGGSFSGLGAAATSSPGTTTLDKLQALLALVKQVRTLSVLMLQAANQGNLTVGVQGQGVWALQVFLITNNILVPAGPQTAKLTTPTSNFDFVTQGGLAEYQKQAGITPAIGFFGPKTRNFIFLKFLQGGSAPPMTQPATATPFLKALRWGMHDPDVARLQVFLGKNPAIYPEGKTSGYFGDATLLAVQRFQLKYGLAHAGDVFYGYVGAKTRAQLNQLMSAGQTP